MSDDKARATPPRDWRNWTIRTLLLHEARVVDTFQGYEWTGSDITPGHCVSIEARWIAKGFTADDSNLDVNRGVEVHITSSLKSGEDEQYGQWTCPPLSRDQKFVGRLDVTAPVEIFESMVARLRNLPSGWETHFSVAVSKEPFSGDHYIARFDSFRVDTKKLRALEMPPAQPSFFTIKQPVLWSLVFQAIAFLFGYMSGKAHQAGDSASESALLAGMISIGAFWLLFAVSEIVNELIRLRTVAEASFRVGVSL